MMTATILGIQTSLGGCIAFYLAGMWITAVYIGAAGYDFDPFCVGLSSVFWPLFWLAVVVTNISCWMSNCARGLHGERTRVIIRYIENVLYYVFLPFRPFKLGREIADMCKSFRRQKGESNGR